MTKMKSKKMTKSTFAIVIMAIVMVAILAFGGTYAYFTAQARVEKVDTIKTANLILRNSGEALKYSANDEIVPGDYIFGDGYLDGVVDWTGAHKDKYQKIELKLGDTTSGEETNAAVYAFVRVTTKAKGDDGKTLMVKHGTGNTDADYAPVLKLIPWTGTVNHTTSETGDKAGSKAVGWNVFDAAAGVGVSSSTYVFYFQIDDTEDCRTAFEEEGFRFSLQFDYRVHADKTELWTDADNDNVVDDGEITYPSTHNVYAETVADGGAKSYSQDGVEIMNIEIEFQMEFAIIQQTGFATPADAFRAAFKSVGDRNNSEYTDNLSPTT